MQRTRTTSPLEVRASKESHVHCSPHNFRATIVSILSLSLIYSPLFALPGARTTLVLPPPKPLPAPIITAAHRAAELLVKFKDSAPVGLQQQVRAGWSHEPAQPLAGRFGTWHRAIECAGSDEQLCH